MLGGPISALAAHGDRIAIATLDGNLEIRDSALAMIVAAPAGTAGRSAVTAMAWSPDGARIAVGRSDGSTRLVDASDGHERLLPGVQMAQR